MMQTESDYSHILLNVLVFSFKKPDLYCVLPFDHMTSFLIFKISFRFCSFWSLEYKTLHPKIILFSSGFESIPPEDVRKEIDIQRHIDASMGDELLRSS